MINILERLLHLVSLINIIFLGWVFSKMQSNAFSVIFRKEIFKIFQKCFHYKQNIDSLFLSIIMILVSERQA